MSDVITHNSIIGLFQKGDIIVSSNDFYFNNLVIDVPNKNQIVTRKLKWFEDGDTVFIVSLVGIGIQVIFGILI